MKIAILFTAIVLLSACSTTAHSYCRRMQAESSFPIALDACKKCYERYGEMDREILTGCAIGMDVVGTFTE